MRHPRRPRPLGDRLDFVVLEDVRQHHLDFVGYEETAGAVKSSEVKLATNGR